MFFKGKMKKEHEIITLIKFQSKKNYSVIQQKNFKNQRFKKKIKYLHVFPIFFSRFLIFVAEGGVKFTQNWQPHTHQFYRIVAECSKIVRINFAFRYRFVFKQSPPIETRLLQANWINYQRTGIKIVSGSVAKPSLLS